MTQKLLVMERQDSETLMKAIKKDVLEADNNSRISAISVNKTLLGMEAWIVLEVPENKDKMYKEITNAYRGIPNIDNTGMTE